MGDDFMALLTEHRNRRADRGHARGEGQAHFTPFRVSQILFQHAATGLFQAIVNVNRDMLGLINSFIRKFKESLRPTMRRAQSIHSRSRHGRINMMVVIPLLALKVPMNQMGAHTILFLRFLAFHFLCTHADSSRLKKAVNSVCPYQD